MRGYFFNCNVLRSTIVALLFVLSGSFSETSAKTVSDLWKTMPDTIIPFLDTNARAEVLAAYNGSLNANNLLNGKTKIDSLYTDFMSVTLTEASSMQLCLLKGQNGDSLLCVVHSYLVPEKESSVSFYDQHWRKLKDINLNKIHFFNKPDTMTESHYNHLLSLIDPYFVGVTLCRNEQTLVVTPSCFALSDEDRLQLKQIISQTRLKWDGITFK